MIEAYQQRQLEPAELMRLDDHVGACRACREALRQKMPTRVAVLKLQASLNRKPPTELQIAFPPFGHEEAALFAHAGLYLLLLNPCLRNRGCEESAVSSARLVALGH